MSREQQVQDLETRTRFGVGDVHRGDAPIQLQQASMLDRLPKEAWERHRREQFTKKARQAGETPYIGKFGPGLEARDIGLAQKHGDFDAATRVAAAQEAREARAKFKQQEQSAYKATMQPAESPEAPIHTLRLTGTRPAVPVRRDPVHLGAGFGALTGPVAKRPSFITSDMGNSDR